MKVIGSHPGYLLKSFLICPQFHIIKFYWMLGKRWLTAKSHQKVDLGQKLLVLQSLVLICLVRNRWILPFDAQYPICWWWWYWGRQILVVDRMSDLIQGPLKIWTEHSQELCLLKIHSRGSPITGLDGGWFFEPWASMYNPKSSYQDLSNEGSKKILSPLEFVFLSCSNMGIFG